jgi:bifunctional DNA-binding transcriptional regulator/antitoxin component of YhaV-PrlF toxin-antitoxin module
MVKVFISKNGQIKATIPKLIAQAMQLKHKQGIEIIFKDGFWEFRKARKGMVKAFLSKNGQMKVTIPKVLAIAMQLRHKDEIEFVFTGKAWAIKKREHGRKK